MSTSTPPPTSPNKVLFGTNFPMIFHGACTEQLDQLGLDEEAHRMFVHNNAVRVFGLD